MFCWFSMNQPAVPLHKNPPRCQKLLQGGQYFSFLWLPHTSKFITHHSNCTWWTENWRIAKAQLQSTTFRHHSCWFSCCVTCWLWICSSCKSAADKLKGAKNTLGKVRESTWCWLKFKKSKWLVLSFRSVDFCLFVCFFLYYYCFWI